MLTDNPFVAMTSERVPVTGRLSGLRLAVKDLFDMAGFTTTAGNPTWAATHSVATATNSSVSALIDAGADFVGKTITDELAYSLNGVNRHYGTPKNPVTPERLPGGSSSGSAVAVSAGLADIGLGTDTGGSIRVPSSYNGLFGLRPTHNRLPCDNMVALAPGFDTIGWMTRDLNTLQVTAEVLFNESTPASTGTSFAVIDNLLSLCEQASLAGQWLNNHIPDAQQVTVDTAALQTGETFRTLQGYEIWQQHGDWINNKAPEFAADITSRMQWCATISGAQQAAAKQQQQHIVSVLLTLVNQFDALILPTTPGRAPLLTTPDNELAEYRNHLLSMTALAGLAGLPQLHLPLFTIEGAPCGLSLLGKPGSDLALIAIAKQLLQQDN